MIRASEAREIVYKGVVDSIHKDIINKSEDGYTMTTCKMTPDVFERYGHELITLLKESGYHVSKPSKDPQLTYFIVSWKEESPFHEDQSEQFTWRQFWR